MIFFYIWKYFTLYLSGTDLYISCPLYQNKHNRADKRPADRCACQYQRIPDEQKEKPGLRKNDRPHIHKYVKRQRRTERAELFIYISKHQPQQKSIEHLRHADMHE